MRRKGASDSQTYELTSSTLPLVQVVIAHSAIEAGGQACHQSRLQAQRVDLDSSCLPALVHALRLARRNEIGRPTVMRVARPKHGAAVAAAATSMRSPFESERTISPRTRKAPLRHLERC